MYRLIYQYESDFKPNLYDSEILEHLQEVRLEMLEFATKNNLSWNTPPFIQKIDSDNAEAQ